MSPYWVDIIGDIVNDVRNDAAKPSGLDALAPYYDYGHPLDIVNKLKQKDGNSTAKFAKYPLIALMMDFKESMGEDMGVRSRVNDMNIILITNTAPNLYADERYTANFRTVLYPLYELLIKHITSSKYFQVSPGLVPHDKYDRPYWGSNGNTGNDYIDAIEIRNLELSLLLTNNCKNKYYGIQ